MKTPTVYVPHEPLRWDAMRNARVPMYDLSAAKTYGALKVCLPNGVALHDTAEISRALAASMETFDEDDYLLAIGSPMMIAIASHIALSNANGSINLLSWDRRSASYTNLRVTVR